MIKIACERFVFWALAQVQDKLKKIGHPQKPSVEIEKFRRSITKVIHKRIVFPVGL